MLITAVVDQGAAGTTIVIAASTGRPIYVKRLVLTMSVTGTIQFQDTAAGALSGVMTLNAGTPLTLESSNESNAQDGWIIPAKGLGLQIVTTAGAAKGWIQYMQ